MKFLLAAAVALVATSPAFAITAIKPAPVAELATGIPAVLAVVGAFAATRFARKK